MTRITSSSPVLPQTGVFSSEWATLLFEITRQFASTLELDEALAKVLWLTCQAVGANVGSIFLVDPAGRVIRSILASGNLPPEIRVPKLAAVMNKGFAGWTLQNRRADIITDTQTDNRWHVFAADTIVARSAMAAPLLRRDEVIGVMTFTHAEANYFTKRHLELLEAIAAQAASAVENAALYTRVSNERATLQAIVGGVQDIILVIDPRDQLILANPAAHRNLSLSADCYNKPLGRVMDEPALLEFYQAHGGAAGDEHSRHEVTIRDGRVFDCSLALLPGIGTMVGMHDVTTFKRLDALKSEFVNHVAHDLKAPLAVIYGYAWVMNELPNLDEETKGHVQNILDSVARMRGLIDNILDLGRIEMGIQSDFAPVDVENVVLEAVTNLRGLADEKKVSLRAQVSPSLPPVNGSALRLSQAVANLVGNALKFTQPGGSVTVRAAQEGHHVVVRVVDTGPGIPPALQAKLFQKFSRLGQKATKDGEGHGLGLAIVKSVVEAHQGRVWVESQLGQGSTFVFSLPSLDAPAQPAAKTPAFVE